VQCGLPDNVTAHHPASPITAHHPGEFYHSFQAAAPEQPVSAAPDDKAANPWLYPVECAEEVKRLRREIAALKEENDKLSKETNR